MATTAASNALTISSDPDVLEQLYPLSLTNTSDGTVVYFPGTLFKESQSNALAVHTYPNLDAGYIENMGRNPAHFNVRAILTNDIFPSENEQWTNGTLFPTVFGALVNLLGDTTAPKSLQHPVYGLINVQVKEWDYELNSKGPRDGAIVNILLIETLTVAGATNIFSAPQGNGLGTAATNLDDLISNVDDPSVNVPGIDMSGFFSSVSSTINATAAFPNETIAAPNIITTTPVYATSLIKNNIQIFGNPVLGATIFSPNNPSYNQSTLDAATAILSLNYTPSQNAFQLINNTMSVVVLLKEHYINQTSSICSPIIEALNQLLLQLQQKQSALSLNTNNQSISVLNYVTPINMTWMQLSSRLNNTIDQLLGINQGLVYGFSVPAFTTINYYQ